MPTCALCARLEQVGINASSGRQGRVMTSDVPQVGLRQLSDNFQVLCPSALLPICAAGRFRRLMTRDVLAVQGVHIRCFPPISKRTWSLPISCRWPTWSLLISYPNLLVGHLLAISENIPRLVHPIFYAEWVAVMMILISECCHNEFGCRSRLSPKPFFQQRTR